MDEAVVRNQSATMIAAALGYKGPRIVQIWATQGCPHDSRQQGRCSTWFNLDEVKAWLATQGRGARVGVGAVASSAAAATSPPLFDPFVSTYKPAPPLAVPTAPPPSLDESSSLDLIGAARKQVAKLLDDMRDPKNVASASSLAVSQLAQAVSNLGKEERLHREQELDLEREREAWIPMKQVERLLETVGAMVRTALETLRVDLPMPLATEALRPREGGPISAEALARVLSVSIDAATATVLKSIAGQLEAASRGLGGEGGGVEEVREAA